MNATTVKRSSVRVARSGAVLGISSAAGPAQAVAVDATSFTIMKRARIRLAFAFDHHFAVAGFRLVA
jgi:hypothetical protein